MAFSAAGATGESPREAATEALPPAASEGREARQQHAYDVSIVAAEAASAASKLFEGHLKERVSQMLLLLQEDPHQQPKEKELNRQPHKWNAHTRPRQSKSTRGNGACRTLEGTSYSSNSSCSSSSSSDERDKTQCSKCKALQQRLKLERLKRRAEDSEAKQLIARVASHVMRLSGEAREAATAAAAAAATAAYDKQQKQLQQEHQLLHEEQRRYAAVKEQLETVQAQLESTHRQEKQLLLQHATTLIEQLLGKVDPLLQLALLRMERLALRLQQLQQQQERWQQQCRLLHPQGQVQRLPLTHYSQATLGLLGLNRQLQQQQQHWQQHLCVGGRESAISGSDVQCGNQRLVDEVIGSMIAGSPQQQQQQLPYQPASPHLSGAPVTLPTSSAPPYAAGCFSGSPILTPAVAFARAAAAAEGLFDVSSGVGVRDCYSSCCKSLPGGLSPVTPGGSRKRGSLLSNASVGKNLSGRHWPFTSAPVADAPVASAASGLAIHHAAPSFIPQNRHARTLERLSAPAQIATRTSTGVCHVSSEADTPEDEIAAKGGEKGEVLAFQATPAVNGSSPHTAVAQLPVARPQKAQTSGLSIAFLGERLQPQRVPSLHKPPAAHLYPLPMSGIPGDLQQEKRDDCCSPFTQANAPLLTSPRVQQSVLEKWAREQQAQRPVQGLSLEAPDWLGDVQKTNACHSDKKEDKELEIVAKKHATDAPMGGDQRINVFHRVEVTQEDKSSTQQQLMQSYAGSISSVDLQGFSSLRMPLRELLNDQESLLEALDAEYREPPVAPHTTDSKYALPLEEEVEKYESAGASVQLGGEDRGNHRDVEGNGSVPMP
ncbi:uncharacterized protein LOC34622823 [Cyclospora cayetanensis]|uniref:Uncharacterized protein LOC34622823 n=1 Tax=Cyclospora cayetanensis TaxID=88456 RepID=A0A6P6RWR6_9EIME|nr:uncharacterized protein LOC34622823 [Cyclospora cayetanensis]